MADRAARAKMEKMVGFLKEAILNLESVVESGERALSVARERLAEIERELRN